MSITITWWGVPLLFSGLALAIGLSCGLAHNEAGIGCGIAVGVLFAFCFSVVAWAIYLICCVNARGWL